MSRSLKLMVLNITVLMITCNILLLLTIVLSTWGLQLLRFIMNSVKMVLITPVILAFPLVVCNTLHISKLKVTRLAHSMLHLMKYNIE